VKISQAVPGIARGQTDIQTDRQTDRKLRCPTVRSNYSYAVVFWLYQTSSIV